MTVFFPFSESLLAINTVNGVLPVPPIYKFPIQIIGILKLISFENFFEKNIQSYQ